MPNVGLTMERSLQSQSLADGLRGVVARSIAAAVANPRSLSEFGDTVTDAASALSSWDNCMSVTFCKWPVIGIIILGSLILLSILWCCARCLFCGLSCCCECCYCLKCCGSCCGMCDPPRGKRHKYLDEPFIPPHQDQGYRSQAPMDTGFTQPFTQPPKADVPQYATFESDKKDADSLPAMPTWNDGNSQKVMLEEEVEMAPIKKPEQTQNSIPNTAGGSVSPSLKPRSTSPGSISPYGPPPGPGGSNGYMRTENDPYATQGTGYYDNSSYGQSQNNGYNQSQGNGYDQSQNYRGAPGYGGATAMTAGRQQNQPQDYDMGDYQGQTRDQGYPQSRTPRPYNDEYGRSTTPGAYSRSGTPGAQNRAGGPGVYGRPPAGGYGYENRSPGPQGAQSYRGSPGPQQGGYSYDQQSQTSNGYGRRQRGLQRQYTGESQNQYPVDSNQLYSGQQRQYPNAQGSQYPAGSQGGYSYDYGNSTEQIAELYSPTTAGPKAAELESAPPSPLHNNSGFDFHSGNSRPSPPPASHGANNGPGYPGHRPYKPQGNNF